MIDKNPHNQCFASSQTIKRDINELFAFFGDARNLEKITPPWLSFQVVKMSADKIQKGTIIDYRLKIHGVPAKWKTEILDWQEGKRFVDFQLKGPYSLWHHTHIFESTPEGTLMRDEIVYRIPFGMLGKLLLSRFIRKDVEMIFSYRRKIIDQLFG